MSLAAHQISRRRLLAAGAASVAAPALAQAQGAPPLDAIIVGAGAAGIAAARRLVAAGRRCVVVEAGPRVGGRCFTDVETFGMPCDLGGRLLYAPEVNRVAHYAREAGIEVSPLRAGQRLRVGGRFAREGEMEAFFAALVRARQGIVDAADNEEDSAAGRALPRNLGDWRPTIEFALGPYRCGKTLDALSVRDFNRSADRDLAGISRAGCGALLQRLAADLPVQLSTPARRVAVWRNAAYVDIPGRMLHARAAIVTLSTNVLASGTVRFDPVLPKAYAEAFTRLSLGVHERVVLEMPGNPLGLAADDLVFEQAKGPRTAALFAQTGATSLYTVELAGPLGSELVKAGDKAMTAFAIDWLANVFGADAKKAVRRTHTTRWSLDPLIRGAASAAPPGAQGDRETLTRPVRDRVFFAGEATHDVLWGTIGGAWESGERAANGVLRLLGVPVRQGR